MEELAEDAFHTPHAFYNAFLVRSFGSRPCHAFRSSRYLTHFLRLR